MAHSDQTLTQGLPCDREPIHIPGAIQPHGFLVAVDDATLAVTHASANLEDFIGRKAGDVLGRPAAHVFSASLLQRLSEARKDPFFGRKAIHLTGAGAPSDDGGAGGLGGLDLVAHLRDGRILIEGERAKTGLRESLEEMQGRLEPILDQMERAESAEALSQLVTREIRRLTGFDRALIYQFDSDWNGRVIAEDRNDRLPSYLDLRFPAEDIPRQARELYRLNRIRLIVSSDYQPVRILADSQGKDSAPPLDLSLSTLRSVSPVHLQYMRNMQTASSMSVSILRNGTLWGLVSCHHHEPLRPSIARRTVCELLSQVFSLQLAAREANDRFVRRTRRHSGLNGLLARLSADEHFVEAMAAHPAAVLGLVGAGGFAILDGENCTLRGVTPSVEEVRSIGQWLGRADAWEVFQTDALSREFPDASACSAVASGLLAVSVSRIHTSYILWFRPEVVETVTWGGEPRKDGQPAPGGAASSALSPRTSFAAWREVVRGRSAPWLPEEVEIAGEFRQALINVVLKRAEERAAMAEELSRANRELAAFSYSVSHDLRAPFRHIRSYAEILREEKQDMLDEEALSILDRILEASHHAGKLVDNLLAFAKMGRTAMQEQPVDMYRVVQELRDELMRLNADRDVTWRISPLPAVMADALLIRQVWRNLLENALKYSRNEQHARIEIGAETVDGFHHFQVKDNGVGFDPRFVDKLFGVFQRLHRTEDFEGTGIGLANVRRIVDRHGGKTWAHGAVGEGASFHFSLPIKELTFEHA